MATTAAPTVRYPTGVRPLLMAETARRRRVESRIVAILERAAFEEIVLPIIDYADPTVDDAQQSYRFVDRDGDLVRVRSDFTPMVARALAPAIDSHPLPLRVFYRGDVIRYETSRLGANREIFQIGAEIVGDPSPTADIAVLRLIASILREFGNTPRIVYSDSSIPEALGRDTRDALSGKNRRDVEGLQSTLSPEGFALALRLTAGDATLADLEACNETAAIGGRLRAIGEEAGPDCALHLDDVDRRTGYYTGLRFRAYVNDSRVVIAQGGRYDELYGRFGTSAPAVGFTLTIDDLD